MATNVLVSKGGRKIASKNIDWNVSVQRFMVFRQENDLSPLTNPQVFALLKEKTKEEMGMSSFLNGLKTRVAAKDKEMKETQCPVCLESQFDLIKDEITLFWPDKRTCPHPVCSKCLNKVLNVNKKVNNKFLFMIYKYVL